MQADKEQVAGLLAQALGQDPKALTERLEANRPAKSSSIWCAV
jgi:hypothetical protein